MTLFRSWLLGVVACAVLVSVAEQLTQGGALRRVVRFAGGMLLMLALLRPLLQQTVLLPEGDFSAYRDAVAELEEALSRAQYDALAADISDRTRAYIEDKADELGLSVRAAVETETVDGVPLPVSVTLYGAESDALSAWIARELGIAKEKQRWIEPEESVSAPP